MTSPTDTAAAESHPSEQLDINSADAADLVRLHGVGPALAARIVAFRDQNGRYNGPSDLARVNGVGQELAHLLAPVIDWGHPAQEEGNSAVWMAAVFALCLAAMLAYLVGVLLSTIRSLPWTFIWANGAFVLVIASMLGASVSFVLAKSDRSRIGAARYHRVTLSFLALSVFASANIVLGVVGLRFHDPTLWRRLPGPELWYILYSSISWIVVGSSVIMVAATPREVPSRLLHTFFNGFVLLDAMLMAAFHWRYPREQWLSWELSVSAIYGAVFLAGGIVILRGISLLQIVASYFSIPVGDDSGNQWIRWVNRHLPDPEDQKDLLVALEGLHPAGRWRLAGLVVASAGLWLLIETAAALLGLAVQRIAG